MYYLMIRKMTNEEIIKWYRKTKDSAGFEIKLLFLAEKIRANERRNIYDIFGGIDAILTEPLGEIADRLKSQGWNDLASMIYKDPNNNEDD